MSIRNAAFRLVHASSAANLLRRAKSRQRLVTVLNLHRVSDEVDFFWQPMRVSRFDALLRYCTKHYNVVTFSQLADAATNPSKPLLVLSFDDGYHDFIENALPLLRRYELPSNHNVVVECAESKLIIWTQRLNHIFNAMRRQSVSGDLQVNNVTVTLQGSQTDWMHAYLTIFKTMLQMRKHERNALLNEWSTRYSIEPTIARMMTWDEITTCAQDGVEIGSHSFSHDSLSTLTSSSDITREVSESKQIIERKLQRACDVFCFPNGQYNDAVMQAVKQAGYKFALLTDNNFQPTDGLITPFSAVSRIYMVDEDESEMHLRVEGLHRMLQRRV